MAGDWIKMRTDLFTHPKVVRIASALKADRLRTVGGLMSVWCLFDAHSVDGKLEGYSLATIDDLIGWPGFAAAMNAVGWLDEGEESLVLPSFDTHNGQSAKRRAQDADRKREVRNLSASEADKKRTREEKRREEEKEDMSGKPDASQSREVLEYLNAKTGSAYRAVDSNLKLIADRLKSGVTVADCKAVVDAKVQQWGKDAAMEQYLRPTTLFRASNFEQYLGQLGGGSAPAGGRFAGVK
ncbi:conserved phage C-terminal domain-containing protein [Cupriavidus respiraculi]|uniref:conserved phage C-terminal domain-containing protein n=1 Tax=Cupriavidus respiraculi TaxID=195930 RepID=UPI001C944367|nr:conserved phage C-terminal domain-containing protein [Cupriavidus respiraculi]MBY4947028.1 conserved phage C-terminal domain-containing protein [Cupriavidus respiraculi]